MEKNVQLCQPQTCDPTRPDLERVVYAATQDSNNIIIKAPLLLRNDHNVSFYVQKFQQLSILITQSLHEQKQNKFPIHSHNAILSYIFSFFLSSLFFAQAFSLSLSYELQIKLPFFSGESLRYPHFLGIHRFTARSRGFSFFPLFLFNPSSFISFSFTNPKSLRIIKQKTNKKNIFQIESTLRVYNPTTILI